MKRVYEILKEHDVRKDTIDYLKDRVKQMIDGKLPFDMGKTETDKCLVIYVQGFVESLVAEEMIPDSALDEVYEVLINDLLTGEEEDEELDDEEDDYIEDEDDDDY